MRNDPTALLRELAAIDRRIENMRYLIDFKQSERVAIVERLRERIGRTTVRLQDDAGTDGQARVVTHSDGRHSTIHPDDVGLLDMGVLTLPPDVG